MDDTVILHVVKDERYMFNKELFMKLDGSTMERGVAFH